MRLLVLGTGVMAKNQVANFLAIDGVEVVGAVDTDPARLDDFADKFNIEKRFRTLDEAIAWGEFDAATNVTPDRIHHPTTMALIAAGKHVFCEKPLAENYAQGAGDDGSCGSSRRHQHGEPHLSQRRAAAARPRDGAGRRARHHQACRSLLSAELARFACLGRLAHGIDAGSGACRPVTARTACSAMSASISSTSPPMARRPISTTSLPA